MLKNILLFLITDHIAKFAALIILLFSVYILGTGTEWIKIFSIIGFVSFSSVVGSLYVADFSKMQARKKSDEKLYSSIFDSIPFDKDFVYWFDGHNFGAKEYSSIYLRKFFTYFEEISLDKTNFFHKQELQDEFNRFMKSVFKFWKTHSNYTIMSGDIVEGVARNGDDYASDPIWYARVKELNDSAAKVYHKYESFAICGKQVLML